MRLNGIRRKLYRITFDKPGINKQALRLHQSLKEASQTINDIRSKRK